MIKTRMSIEKALKREPRKVQLFINAFNSLDNLSIHNTESAHAKITDRVKGGEDVASFLRGEFILRVDGQMPRLVDDVLAEQFDVG